MNQMKAARSKAEPSAPGHSNRCFLIVLAALFFKESSF